MDIAYIIGLLLFFIHIIAFIAGGANSVVMPIIGTKMATATPEVRASLMSVAMGLAQVGKIAMGTLLVSGVLVLWLKWNFVVPNAWFWVKMVGIVLMIVFISLNERTQKAGGPDAPRRSKIFGQLTALSFALVILAAVFAFN
jgi:uncharacterized membrane protein